MSNLNLEKRLKQSLKNEGIVFGWNWRFKNMAFFNEF